MMTPRVGQPDADSPDPSSGIEKEEPAPGALSFFLGVVSSILVALVIIAIWFGFFIATFVGSLSVPVLFFGAFLLIYGAWNRFGFRKSNKLPAPKTSAISDDRSIEDD